MQLLFSGDFYLVSTKFEIPSIVLEIEDEKNGYSNWSRHVTSAHTSGQDKFRCHVCNRKYDRQRTYDRHFCFQEQAIGPLNGKN